MNTLNIFTKNERYQIPDARLFDVLGLSSDDADLENDLQAVIDETKQLSAIDGVTLNKKGPAVNGNQPEIELCNGTIYEQKVTGKQYFVVAHGDFCDYHQTDSIVHINQDDVDLIESLQKRSKEANDLTINPYPITNHTYIYIVCIACTAAGIFTRNIYFITPQLLFTFLFIIRLLKYFKYQHVMDETEKVNFWTAIKYEQVEKDRIKRKRKIKFAAYYYKFVLQKQLGNIGYAYISRQGGRHRMKTPTVSWPIIEDDRILYKLRSMPYRTRFIDLMDDGLQEELSIRLEREIKIELEDNGKALFIEIFLRSGTSGIIDKFHWQSESDPLNALTLLPKNARFRIPIGLGKNRRMLHQDLREMPHLLIAGATKQGKTTYINCIICTLIKRNKPEQLKIILVDLKRVEFPIYRSIPHLMMPVVDSVELAQSALQKLLSEMETRFQTLQDGDYASIQEYNAGPRKMPYILFVVDEFAEIALSEIKKESERILTRLIQLGRAVGIHIIIATQVITSKVITTIIRSNFSERIAFRVGDITGSKTILDSGIAASLPAVRGRMIYRAGAEKRELQAPLITKDQVLDLIKSVSIVDEKEKLEAEPPLQKVTRFILDNGGNYNRKFLMENREKLGVSINMITKTIKGGLKVDFDGDIYEYQTGPKGSKVVLCNDA